MKFTFIKQHSREFSIKRMCDVLEVSRSGYYAWLKRGTSQRAPLSSWRSLAGSINCCSLAIAVIEVTYVRLEEWVTATCLQGLLTC